MINAVFIGVVVGILMLILSDPLKWLWGIVGIKIPEIDGMNSLRQASPAFLLTRVGIIDPILEEIIGRFIPLYLAALSGNNYIIWSIAIFCSIAFGFLHGSWKHILSLGVVGMVLSWLFINFGFASCLAAHITNNFLCSCYFLLKRNVQYSPRLS